VAFEGVGKKEPHFIAALGNFTGTGGSVAAGKAKGSNGDRDGDVATRVKIAGHGNATFGLSCQNKSHICLILIV